MCANPKNSSLKSWNNLKIMKLAVMEKSTMLTVFKVIVIVTGATLVVEMCLPMPMSKKTPKVNIRRKIPESRANGQNNTFFYFDQDDHNTLIDLKHFEFVTNPNACHQNHLLLLIMIPTSPHNFELRSTIRTIWQQHLDNAKLVFLLGLSVNTSIAQKVKEEHKINGDIVQGNFIDAYKNLTYKHTMGLKWVVYHCRNARLVLKLDDDVFVHMQKFKRFLTRTLSPWGSMSDLLACRPSFDREVKRTGKWAVSKTEIPESSYPEYCMGYFIVYSQDVVRRLLERVQNLPYLWIDDVQITGFAARDINVTITPTYNLAITYRHSDELMENTNKSNVARKHFPFGPNSISDNMTRHMWKTVILNNEEFAKWKKLIGRHKPKCFLPKTFRLWESLPSEDFPEDCDMGLFMKGWRIFFKELQIIRSEMAAKNKTLIA